MATYKEKLLSFIELEQTDYGFVIWFNSRRKNGKRHWIVDASMIKTTGKIALNKSYGDENIKFNTKLVKTPDSIPFCHAYKIRFKRGA